MFYQYIDHGLCTLQTQLFVECRRTGCRVCISVYSVSGVRELFHLVCQIRQVHCFTWRDFGRTDIEEYGTRCYIRIGNNHFGFRNFGHRLAKGVRTALEEEGAVGILTGGLTAAAAGITTSLVCGVVCSWVGKSHDQN